MSRRRPPSGVPAGARLNLRRVFERTQAKRAPLLIEDEWGERDALAILVGGPLPAVAIRAELERRPELLEAPISELLHELASVEGVGRSAAVRFVAAEVYRSA